MFKKHFCSSPWIHCRITNTGDYEVCRWQKRLPEKKYNIKTTEPIDFFQKHMRNFRKSHLQGEYNSVCETCYVMEEHGKVSGRQKQLLKTGIMIDHFEKSFLSSPLFKKFKESEKNNGETDLLPVDWQIDLGNYCNSACIMCGPSSSSKLANEWYQLGFLKQPHNNWSWAQDNFLLDKFLNFLCSIKDLRYLHFLGGETLITPAFKKVLAKLIENKLNENTIIGLTTNLTVWPHDVIELLKQFKFIHLGMSIETLNSLNDYIRWPSKIKGVKKRLNEFIELGHSLNWTMSLRITPNLFTVYYIDELYHFALQNKLNVESCNFIYKPECLRLDLLSTELRLETIKKLENVLELYKDKLVDTLEINIRRKDIIETTVLQDLKSLISYLKQQPVESQHYPELVKFLKTLENKRKNNIIDHAPEFRDFLKNIGY